MGTTINVTSRQPGEHEVATFRNGIYRLHRLPLTKKKKTQEFSTTLNIAEHSVIGENKSKTYKIKITQKKILEILLFFLLLFLVG
jgi:hypothetical protein